MINTRIEKTEKATPHTCSQDQNKQLLYLDPSSIFQKKPTTFKKLFWVINALNPMASTLNTAYLRQSFSDNSLRGCQLNEIFLRDSAIRR